VSAPATRPPGRPRSPAADTAIVRATLEVLVSEGYRALTMEQVRARAGVGKATLYRRYGSKEELVKAAVAHMHGDLTVPPDTGSLRGDFQVVVDEILAAAQVTGALTFMPRVLAEVAGDREMHAIFFDALVAPRRKVLETILRRAVARGEVREDADLDLAIDLIVGPMIYRVVITGGEVEGIAERPMQVLETVLAGLSPRGR
jgi:AcrR family transcriptional regulator